MADAPPAKRARGGRAPVQPAIEASALGDAELMAAVLAGDGLDEAAENWVVAYQTEPTEALAQLLQFLLRLSGCAARVDANDVRERDAFDGVVERVQDEFVQHAVTAYPIVARTKALKGVRRAAAALLERLFHDASESDILGDDDFLESWTQWLAALAVSPLRPLRHTATAAALWTIDALSAQLEEVRESFDVAGKQRAAETRRDGTNRTRLAHTAQKMEQLDALRDSLDAHLDELLRDVYAPRSRDLDAAVRLDCIAQLGQWMKRYPAQYLQEFYYRHIAAALSDTDVRVRASALRALKDVYTPAHAAALAPMLDANKKRLIDMALYDVDLGVRTTAFAVLEAASAQDVLGQDERAALAVHIFDLEPRIRLAAAAFVLALLEQEAPSTEAWSVAHTHALASLLVRYEQQLISPELDSTDEAAAFALLPDPGLGRIGVALEALWDTSERVQPWEPYIELLLEERALSAAEEAAAVEMLAMAVHLTHTRGDDDDDSEAPAWEACSTALIDALPKLLARFSADAPRLADLLWMLRDMDLDVYHETRNMSAFDALWEDVCGHFWRHTEPQLLRQAAEAIKLLLSAPVAVGSRAAKLLTLQDNVLSRLQDTIHERQVDTTVFTADDVHHVQASLARLHVLLKALDVHTLLDDPLLWDSVLALARRGRLGYAQENEVRPASHRSSCSLRSTSSLCTFCGPRSRGSRRATTCRPPTRSRRSARGATRCSVSPRRSWSQGMHCATPRSRYRSCSTRCTARCRPPATRPAKRSRRSSCRAQMKCRTSAQLFSRASYTPAWPCSTTWPPVRAATAQQSRCSSPRCWRSSCVFVRSRRPMRLRSR